MKAKKERDVQLINSIDIYISSPKFPINFFPNDTKQKSLEKFATEVS